VLALAPDMYAIQRPSGDQRGFAVVLRNVVNKRRPLPSAPIVAIAPGLKQCRLEHAQRV
jgi:hypothetical protein